MTFHVGFVLFPKLTQLDFTGPLQVLARVPDAQVHLAAHTLDPVETDSVLRLLPTVTFEDCPQLDLLCVPGGQGVAPMLSDGAIVDFIARQGAGAKYVTSVCTGAFLLGAAGLLKGRRATTHWAYTSLLPMVGATWEKARVVRDGNLFTAGGVTSGIDFGLTVLDEIAGREVAQSVQLGLEYAPNPPFGPGDPDSAPDGILAAAKQRYAGAVDAYRAALGAGA